MTGAHASGAGTPPPPGQAPSPPYVIEPLDDTHDRTAFTCGVDALDRYFATQAAQDVRRRVAACFVAREAATGAVSGFYTLSASSFPLPDLPASIAKKLPRYPLVPAVRVGRLAVAASQRGKGLGAGLLVDSMTRAWKADIMAFAIVVDAKDDAAVAFYQHHGFTPFASMPRTLFLPLVTVAKQLGLQM